MTNAERESSAAELTEVVLDEEAARLQAQSDAADVVVLPDEGNSADVPVLQLRNIDFSYGPVQVLFDVHLEVRRGETLALLGTNGAGKTTLLRLVSGLGAPSRGVVRLNGDNVTRCSPQTRVKQGIHQLAGGNAIFAPMSVRENLEMAGFVYRKDRTDRRARFERALAIFPDLEVRLSDTAGLLSGGQQQMLGLAMALMHDPEILLIDELSLGLAPVMVESLLGVVDRLKANGQTMIIVEQSLNVALALAERAVFMEKGRICFEGPSAELLEREDLVRAVFLGGEHA
jgi:ABC-type branched-subunit amino acid transport system ATPase component